MSRRKKFALARLIAAVLLAAALLGVTGVAVADLLSGPVESGDVSGFEEGAYVKTEIAFVMDIVGVERSAGGREKAYYAVSPVGNTFMLLRFPVSDKENLDALADATERFLMGETLLMDIFMHVTGTVTAPDHAETELLLTWFEENENWLLTSGIIADRYNYDSLIGGSVLCVGTVGSVNTGVAVATSVVALLFVLYAAAEAVSIGVGVYNKEKEQKRAGTEEILKPAKAPEEAPDGEEETEEEEKNA